MQIRLFPYYSLFLLSEVVLSCLQLGRGWGSVPGLLLSKVSSSATVGGLVGSWEEPGICTAPGRTLSGGCCLLFASNSTVKCLVSAKLYSGQFFEFRLALRPKRNGKILQVKNKHEGFSWSKSLSWSWAGSSTFLFLSWHTVFLK